MSVTARPYQVAAVESVFDRLLVRDEPSTLLILPTGTGKTVCFGLVAQRWSRDHLPGRVLVLAHREELISQAVAELSHIVGIPPAVEMAEKWAVAAGSTLGGDVPPVVVASVQSLCQPRRLERWPKDEFGLIVTDEAHHATAASYRRIFDHFARAKRLGVTATPKRADDFALGSVFKSVCYDMGICDAVDEGWLVPVEQRYVTVKSLDLSAVGTQAGDFAQGQLGAVLTGDSILDQMVAATVELCGEEPTLIFTAPRPAGEVVSQGDLFADALNKIKPGRAVFLSGETERDIRRRELEQFELGGRQYLVGCSLFTEGFNVPKIARVVMARPTKSVVYYTQAIGRGTRTLRGTLSPDQATAGERQRAIAASAKPSVLVIDFVGNSGRHKLVSAVDIFAGKMPSEVVERAKLKATNSARSVQAVLDEAEAELKKEREQRAEAERRRKERNRSRVKVNRVDMHQHAVDPYSTSDAPGQRVRHAKGGRATTMQVEWIKNHGGYCQDGISADEAGRIIADIKDRWAKKLCSPRQERALKKCGAATGPICRYQAAALMDYLSKNNWRLGGALTRKRLGIARVANGLSDGYQLTIDRQPVGGIFDSPAKVRDVFAGLVKEPVLA